MAAVTSQAPPRTSCRPDPGYTWPSPWQDEDFRWYGSDVLWRLDVEGRARQTLGDRLRVCGGVGKLVYDVRDVALDGDPTLRSMRIEFHRYPAYVTYGLPPQEYPRVFAEPDQLSKHRMPDDALCLWFPHDPVERRWRPANGLLTLIELACRHLFAEQWWRDNDVWLLDEAPHGFDEKAA